MTEVVHSVKGRATHVWIASGTLANNAPWVQTRCGRYFTAYSIADGQPTCKTCRKITRGIR